MTIDLIIAELASKGEELKGNLGTGTLSGPENKTVTDELAKVLSTETVSPTTTYPPTAR